MFRNYRLELVVDRLVGGIPRHPDIVRRWQETRWPDRPKLKDGDPLTPQEAADRTIELLGEQVHEEVAGIWTGFVESEDGGIAIEGRQVKAMFKESANILRTMIKVGGKTIPLRARVAERVFVTDSLIAIDGTPNPETGKLPTGTIERPIHVMTAQGPRTALKRTDYVDKAIVGCDLKVLDDGMITTEILDQILTHAALNGIGTDRSQGAGMFQYVLTEGERDD
jgi:hypothetical protein